MSGLTTFGIGWAISTGIPPTSNVNVIVIEVLVAIQVVSFTVDERLLGCLGKIKANSDSFQDT